MNKYIPSLVFIFCLSVLFSPINNSFAGIGTNEFITFHETDSPEDRFLSLFYFFDLRDRETFIQLTHPDVAQSGLPTIAHIQIFDVSNNCNENDFFDNYTVNDTHTYNMRNIQTNDGNDSGVVLPDNSYGLVAITLFEIESPSSFDSSFPIGNQRILDNNGYEYRTNALAVFNQSSDLANSNPDFRYTFNFNSNSGVTHSDVIGMTATFIDTGSNTVFQEWDASSVIEAYQLFDIDIINNNEVPFSCRDVIFACVNENSSRLTELLEFSGGASVASFEYGINNVIPHSKGGELLCPGNNTEEGIVILQPETQNVLISGEQPYFFGYIGLNNGNSRGSFDSFWITNAAEDF